MSSLPSAPRLPVRELEPLAHTSTSSTSPCGRSFDLPVVTLSPFVEAGGGVFRQVFDTAPGGVAPDRTSFAGQLGAGRAARLQLGAGGR